VLSFPRNLAALAAVADKADGRFATSAVHVLDLGGACYRVEATDGKRLAVVRGPCPPCPAPALTGLGGAPDVLIPAKEWRAALRLGDRRTPAVALAAHDGKAVFASGEASQTVPLQADGRFPQVDAVLPQRRPLLAVRVHPGQLAGLLGVAQALEPEGGVALLYYGAGKPLGLAAHNDQGQYFDGLMMPLTT
jgi:hypothetical protein